MIRSTPASRALIAELKAEIRKIEEPHKKAQRQALKEAKAARVKAVGRPVAGQRQPRQRDNPYLAATRREPCLVGLAWGDCDGPTDPAHLRFSDFARGRINPGKGAKPDDKWVNPCCRHHHEEQHARGDERAFWEEHGFADIGAVCEARYAAFQAGAPTTPILHQAAAEARQARAA